ncbi:MAG TPA: hypothetical protein VEQ86_05335 [Xanthobacteraceae bacterium]|nr:hypothetical protein [Xanthobacteraceae bacterium]
MSTPTPRVAGAGATVVSLGVDDGDAAAVSGDGAMVGASSGVSLSSPGIAC